MTNEYFDSYSALPRNALARAEAVNAIFDAIIVGFDNVPASAALKQDRLSYAADTGTAGAYAIAPTYPILSYIEGQRYSFKAANANAGASTINVSNVGVKTIKRQDGNDLAANDITAGRLVWVQFDGTNFQLMTAAGSDVIANATAAAAAAASQVAAATSASAASTSASGAATSQTAAAASATAAAGSATSASTSATSATSSASSATSSASAASTSATNAGTSASSASTSATTATTQAGNALTSATAASGSASTASTQATNASTSATAAAASATAAAVSATTAAATVAQWAVATGTADAITAAFPTTVVSLTNGLTLAFRASAANTTTTPTFKADGTTAHTITKLGGLALVAGDIPANLAECRVRYNLANTRWELLNPAQAYATGLLDLSGAAAGQIKFPATQNQSADPNTLDDYEEGTFTPIDGSSATLTFTNVSGDYQKIGNKVFINGTAQFPTTANGASVTIGGLPFSTLNSSTKRTGGGLTVGLSSAPPLGILTTSNATSFGIFNQTTGNFALNSLLSTAAFWFGFFYLTSG